MSAWEDYHRALVDLHASAGAPSSREISRRSASDISHTTVNQLLKGKRFSSWAVLHKTLSGLGADQATVDRFSDLWVEAYRELRGLDPTEAPSVTTVPTLLGELQSIRHLLAEILVELRQRREGDS